MNRCRLCGCTDDDCSRCLERTGARCYWVEGDLCSACVGTELLILRGYVFRLVEALGEYAVAANDPKASDTNTLTALEEELGGISADMGERARPTTGFVDWVDRAEPRIAGLMVEDNPDIAIGEPVYFDRSSGEFLARGTDGVVRRWPATPGALYRLRHTDRVGGLTAGDLAALYARPAGEGEGTSDARAAADAGLVTGVRVRLVGQGLSARGVDTGTIHSVEGGNVSIRWDGPGELLDSYSIQVAVAVLEVMG